MLRFNSESNKRRRDARRARGAGLPGRAALRALEERARTFSAPAGDVLLFPLTNWHYRIQRGQHFAIHLARLGYRVFSFEARRVHGNRHTRGFVIAEEPLPGVFLVLYAGTRRAAAPWLRAKDPEGLELATARLHGFLDRLGVGSAAALVQGPFWHPFCLSTMPRTLVYDCIDEHSGFEDAKPWMVEREAALLDGADAVTVSSQALERKIAARRPVTLIRNGVEPDLFLLAHRSRMPGTPPRVGYVGAISHWFDMPLVMAAAAAYPNWRFELVGATTGCDTRPARHLRNIVFTGEIPYADVPEKVSSFDVCLIPFRLNALTQATDPIKLYEYLSAGKPVVATALPELETLNAPVSMAETPGDFVTALDRAMKQAGDWELAQERRAWASRHSWRERVGQLAVLLNGHPHSRGNSTGAEAAHRLS